MEDELPRAENLQVRHWFWSGRRDSNPRPPPWQGNGGRPPSAPCVRRRRSEGGGTEFSPAWMTPDGSRRMELVQDLVQLLACQLGPRRHHPAKVLIRRNSMHFSRLAASGS